MAKQPSIMNIKRIFGLLLSVLLILSVLTPVTAFAAEGKSETKKVGFFAFDGYHEIDENGQKSGYGYDFLTLIKRYADVTYEYVGYDKSWSDMQQMLLDGEIDMVTSAHKTAAREELFDFSLPIGTNAINLNVRADDTRFTTGSYSGYNGMKIGMIEGSSSNDRFAEFAQEKGFTFSTEYYSDADALEEALISGKVDAVVSSSLRKMHGEKILEEFNTEYFYAIVRKGDTELLDKINYAIRQMNCNEGDWKNTLYYSNYLSENHAELHFTDEELAFLEKYSSGADKLTFAVDTDWIPFSWEENGEYVGILPEMISHCMKLCGMNYELYASNQVIVDASVLSNEQVNMYIGYSMSDEIAEKDGLVASDAILDCGTAYLLRKETTEIKTVAVCATTPYLNTRLQADDSIILKEYPDTIAAREAVVNKEVDAAFLYDYDAQYTSNHDLSGSLAYELVSNGTIPIKAVMRSSDDRTLMGIWMKCIRHMSDTEKNAIISKYISHSASSMTIKDYALLHPFIFFGSFLCMILIVLAAIGIAVRHSMGEKHRIELEEKIEEITALNDQLQDNQTRLEESAAEQEAQLEEITALNGELEENQAQLEEAASEQEAQIAEVNALNAELEVNRTRLERQLAVIGATSQRYFCVYYIEVETHQFKEIFCPANMHAVLGAEGDAILPLELVWKKLVIPEDQDSMRQFNDIANWNDFLSGKEMYSREYRGITSGWSRATLFAVSRDSDENVTSVVYASEMIHEQKKAELALDSKIQEITLLNSELEERQAQLEESTAEQEAQLAEIQALNEDLEKKSSMLERHLGIIGSLANTFQALYYVDMTDGSFVELGKSREQVENVIGKKGNTKASFEAMCNYLVIPEQKVVMETFTDLSTIQERLGSRPFISQQYCGQNGVWSEGFFVPVSRDEADSVTGLLWGVRHIDEFKQKELRAAEELTKAKEAAEAANNAKTSFLFNMSHDIRTPMNAIIGFRDLLEKHQENPEKRADYLKKIEESSSVLLSIINNVLEMARIEKGTIEIDESAWSAEQFNDTLYSIFNEMMNEKGITFTRQIDVKNPYVYCDPIKLREVFINILSNAYKYTNAGGSVHMHLEEIPSDREGYAMYQTTITDTGIGMSEDFLPHIFEEFSRENSTTYNKIEGTGLGMPIVKRLVDLMEGTIEVRSEKGVGSTFIVTIPHRITEKSSLVEHAGVEIDPKLFVGKRILLAEDNELNAEIATEILGEAGFIVDHAEDGMICCEKLSSAADNHYDLILMDIQMPNMNGYDAARTIRKMQDSAKGNIPILAMTANAFEEDKREALRSGMNGHLAKPINVAELMRALAGILG